MKLNIGIDDTDSPQGGCTTYLSALIVEELKNLHVSFLDFPCLIRLNPNVPWKTRGNGAICLRIECKEFLLEDIKEKVLQIVEEHADLSYEGTDPGIVFLEGDVPDKLVTFAKATICDIVKQDTALRLIKSIGAEAVGFKKGRGIIGSLAAIGETLSQDYTFELITYRIFENRGKPRKIDKMSVIRMNKKLGLKTFGNIDLNSNRVLITPRGPDPVLYGIRGETVEVVRVGHNMIKPEELVERWIVFRTNQGTDAHLGQIIPISEAEPFKPVTIKGEVMNPPITIRGGHVIFSISDHSGEICCAAYKPTGDLASVAGLLRVGDIIEASGGVRPKSSKIPITVNLEKINVIFLSPKFNLKNPLCTVCNKRMKSRGKHQGYKCSKCGLEDRNLQKEKQYEKRSLIEGIYVTSPRSQRHLTKPITRYGFEKKYSAYSKGKVKNFNFLPYNLFSSG